MEDVGHQRLGHLRDNLEVAQVDDAPSGLGAAVRGGCGEEGVEKLKSVFVERYNWWRIRPFFLLEILALVNVLNGCV